METVLAGVSGHYLPWTGTKTASVKPSRPAQRLALFSASAIPSFPRLMGREGAE